MTSKSLLAVHNHVYNSGFSVDSKPTHVTDCRLAVIYENLGINKSNILMNNGRRSIPSSCVYSLWKEQVFIKWFGGGGGGVELIPAVLRNANEYFEMRERGANRALQFEQRLKMYMKFQYFHIPIVEICFLITILIITNRMNSGNHLYSKNTLRLMYWVN